MSDVILVSAQTWDKEVVGSTVPVLVDFYADWCGPCQRLKPLIERIATAYRSKAKVCKVNADMDGALAQRFKVTDLPTVVAFKPGGGEDERFVGLHSEDSYRRVLDELLAAPKPPLPWDI